MRVTVYLALAREPDDVRGREQRNRCRNRDTRVAIARGWV
jgi:hypothetical protein